MVLGPSSHEDVLLTPAITKFLSLQIRRLCMSAADNQEDVIELVKREDFRGNEEYVTNFDIETEIPGISEPVFQIVQEQDQESWIMRWNSEAVDRYGAKGNLASKSRKAARKFGLSDDHKEEKAYAYFEVPGDLSQEEGMAENIRGAVNTGFTVEEALEHDVEYNPQGDMFYLSIENRQGDRVYRAEIVDDEVLVGLQGYSRFRENDLGFLIPKEENYGGAVRELGEITSHMEDKRD